MHTIKEIFEHFFYKLNIRNQLVKTKTAFHLLDYCSGESL